LNPTKLADKTGPLRFVQIGSMAGEEIQIPASLLRFRANVLMGSGADSVAMDRVVTSVSGLLACAGQAGFGI